MSEMMIRLLDPFNEADLTHWHQVYWIAEKHGREDLAAAWTLEELRVTMQEPSRRSASIGLLGEVDGVVVSSGFLSLPLLDNQEVAEVHVSTLPGQRRRGLGSAMLAAVEQVVREHDRALIQSESGWAYELGPSGAGAPGLEFALHHGFHLGLGDVMRELALPVADDLLARLAADVAPHHTAYTLESWVGPVPDALAQGWEELAANLMTEAPTGDLDRAPGAVDLEARREADQTLAKQGRTKINTVALDAERAVVAYTEIVTTIHEPDRAYQWGTLVRRADRGHRLGLAVKVANLQLLQRQATGLHRLMTWNAEVNDHMIGVNEQLGFRAVERLGEFQKRLE